MPGGRLVAARRWCPCTRAPGSLPSRADTAGTAVAAPGAIKPTSPTGGHQALGSRARRPAVVLAGRLLAVGCGVEAVAYRGGRAATASNADTPNWIAVVGPGTYGRGAALYVAQAGSTCRSRTVSRYRCRRSAYSLAPEHACEACGASAVTWPLAPVGGEPADSPAGRERRLVG